MTAVAWVFLAVAALAGPANWWSRWVGHRPTEVWSKPLTLAALIGVAVAIDPIEPAVRAWFVVALVLSLAGDVFLLGTDRWFVPGLAAFLGGHLAYTAGFVARDEWRWWALGPAALVLAGVAVTLGRRIVEGAALRRRSLRVPVIAYLGVISLMVLAAAAAGGSVALGGAVLFLVSDTVLGWRLFVGERRWMPLAVMVTYHLAQAALVISLIV